MTEEKPMSKGELLTVTGIVAAILYAVYRGTIWLIHAIMGVAIKGWAVLKAGLAGAGFMVAVAFGCAATLDISLLGIDRILRAWRVRRGIGSSTLPRYRTYTGDKPASWLDMFLLGVVRTALERSYGQGAVVDEAAFSAFVRRSLPGLVLRPENRSRIEARVMGPLYARVQQGEPALEAWLERYGKRRRRRPFFVVCRLAYILSRRQIGWSEAQSWKTPDPDRLKSDPKAFERFFWECGWSGITAVEAILKEELALGDGEWTPPRAMESAGDAPARQETQAEPWRQATPLALPPASGIEIRPEVVVTNEGPGEDDRQRLEGVPVSDGVLAADAELVVQQALGRLHQDGEWWQEPGELLASLSEDLLLAAAHHPTPDQVHELRSQVQGMQARLSGFGQWFRAQMEGPYEAWSPVMQEAISQVSEPSAEVVERNALRCFLHAGGEVGREDGGEPGAELELEAALRQAPSQGAVAKEPAVLEVEAREPQSVAGPEIEAPAGKPTLSFLRQTGGSKDLASEVF